GAWLGVVFSRLRLPLRPDRVARPAVDRDSARPRRDMDSLLREGAGGLAREQAPAAGKQGRGESAPVFHLQARPAVQHADGLLVDGECLLRLLFDLGAVRDLPAEGAELD